jgi:hypothetical protein
MDVRCLEASNSDCRGSPKAQVAKLYSQSDSHWQVYSLQSFLVIFAFIFLFPLAIAELL